MTDTGTVVADPYGDEWCTYAAALEQVPGLKASTLRGWVHSGKVRTLPRNDTPPGGARLPDRHPRPGPRRPEGRVAPRTPPQTPGGRLTGTRRIATILAVVHLYPPGPSIPPGTPGPRREREDEVVCRARACR